jgi:hypothetical protein
MPPENEDVLQKLSPSIVEIISDKEDSTTLGTGFVVTDDGLIVTCRHVISESQGKLMNSVRVRFHSDAKTDTKKFTASLLKGEDAYSDHPSIDIAFLKLDSLPEKGVTPVKLDGKVVRLNHFASIGFKKAEEFTGLSAKGEIGIPTRIKNSNGHIISPEVIELYSPNQIEPGMSGAPVLDIERDRVVGIVSERYTEEYDPTVSNIAFALPVKAMVDLYPPLREKNQGLTVLSKFLRAIGEEGSSIYKWIDEVYVPPLEYEDIKESLKRDRIVFITGTKEFGKTFTAVRLMYEFFKDEDYQPRWIKQRTEQGGPEGADPRELMKVTKMEDYLKPHQIVYFEDLFGKTKYERSSDLVNYLGNIIDSIRRIEDAYVIITSREEVFKQFEIEQLSSVELANFEKKLNLKRASYSPKKRKEMLYKWAKVYNCKWLLDDPLTDHVLGSIEYQLALLPTPINIREFAFASYDTIDKVQLERLIQQKSKETARRFADEIMEMAMKEDEKIIFLTLPYLGNGNLDIDLIKNVYDRIITVREQSQKIYTNFNMVKKWFEGDKLNISDGRIEFSHPSYHEAFQYAIDSDRPESVRIRHIFVEVLMNTIKTERIQDDDIADVAARTIIKNFDKLPSNVHEILFRLADSSDTSSTIFRAIADHFDNLPPDTLEQLLSIVAREYKVAPHVATFIISNFNRLPSNVHEILFRLENDCDAVWELTDSIVKNYDKLPSNVQHILFTLADSDKSEAHDSVAYAIADHFDNLPPDTLEQLLLKLANKDSAREKLSSIVRDRTINIGEDTRKEILSKLEKSFS